jgi:hypothetical protein
MPTIKKKHIGDQQYGGAARFGNVTTLRATLQTTAAGAAINSDSTTAIAVADVVVLEKLPQGFLLEDAQVIVSKAFPASVTGSLGFIYIDGVDSTEVPQDAAYFGAGLALSALARLRTTSPKAPVSLAKEAYLVLTIAGAAINAAAQLDVIVHGERMGPK